MLDGFRPAAFAQLHRDLDEPTGGLRAVRVDITRLDAAVETLITRLDHLVDVLAVGEDSRGEDLAGMEACRTATVLLQNRQVPEAIDAAERARLLAPGRALPELVLALCHLRGGRTTVALAHLRAAASSGEAQEQRPRVTAALIAAAVLAAADRPDDAVEVLEEAYAIGPSIPVLLALIIHGRTEPAAGQLLELMASNPFEIPADLPVHLMGAAYFDQRWAAVQAHDALRATAQDLAAHLAEVQPTLRPLGEPPRSPRRKGRAGRQARRLAHQGLTFDAFRRHAARQLRNIRAIDKSRAVVARFDQAAREADYGYAALLGPTVDDAPLWRVYLSGRKLRVVVKTMFEDVKMLTELRRDALDATDELRALLAHLDKLQQPTVDRMQTELRQGWEADRTVFMADQEELLAQVMTVADRLAPLAPDVARRPASLGGWLIVDRRPSRRPLVAPLVDLPLPVPVEH